MPSLTVEIGFEVSVEEPSFFEDQVVEARGALPKVRIQRLPEKPGLHYFFIEKRIPHHPSVLDAVQAEAERQMEVLWNVVSHLLDFPVRPTGEVHYLHEGKLRRMSQRIAPGPRARGGVIVGAGWFEANEANLSLNYDIDLLKRFNFARFLDDPISRYLSLYALLLGAVGERQDDVDDALLAVDPTIECSVAAGRKRTETTFTRLRNEIAHHRAGSSLTQTHREVRLQLPRFTWLVREVLAGRITKR